MQDPKIAKNSPSGHHRTTLSGCIFATKACVDNRKKLVKQQYLLHMSSQYGERRPTNGWDRFGNLGTPVNFNGFCVLPSLLQRRRYWRPTKLCTMFGRLLGWYTNCLSFILYDFNLDNSLRWGTVSNAFAKSVYIAWVSKNALIQQKYNLLGIFWWVIVRGIFGNSASLVVLSPGVFADSASFCWHDVFLLT